MSHTLTAKEQSLAKVFSDDYVFTIPGYQRPYAWGTDQAQELLDDLLSALADAPSELSEANPYFLGSIVLIKGEASPEATVVDGQQRLTTLTLLLSCIRACVQNSEMQKDITSCIYERGSLVKGTQARYRLSLRERDRQFFRDNVQHEDGLAKLLALTAQLSDSQNRLRANAQLLMAGLKRLDEGTLTRLVQFIITRCYLVTVATPDLDSAYRIFGVMNSRGLDLSATDILKADILGALPDAQRDQYTQRWEETEEDLGREAFGELFSHIRMVYRKAKPQSTLLKEFKAHVTPVQRPQRFMDDVLLPMAKAFEELISAGFASQRKAEEINEQLRWLNRLEFKDWVPPALVFFVRHRNDPEALLSFFTDLERLGYSLLVRRSGINDRIDRFSKLTAAIERGDDLEAADSPLQLSPLEQNEVYQRLDGPLYDTLSSRVLAVLLMRLDRLVADKQASYQHDVVSVEHVMPQQPAPRSKWQEWVPDAQVHQYWVHRLGNLALLSRNKNSSASNRDFDWKKASYFTKGGVSSFALTTQVLQHPEWTVDVMGERQAELMRKLEQHWRLQDRQSKEAAAEALLSELGQDDGGVVFELESARHGLTAQARETGEALVVLAGSQAKQEWSGQLHSYKQLREDLVAEGVLKPSADGRHWEFSRDTAFKSPSAASAVVLGRTDNGRNSWRIKGSTVTYAAWQDNLPATRSASGRVEV